MDPLVLCSASPRRAALLRGAGIPFERGPAPDVDETPPPGLPPDDAAEALALRKWRAVAPRLPGRVVLAADTVVALPAAAGGAEFLAKPADAPDARRMLRRLSGRTHRVVTGVAVGRDGEVRSGREAAEVTFRPLSDAEIDEYVATGEPLDKAGAYGIQGGAAGFVARLDGEVDAVVGLPVGLVRRCLAALGASRS